MAVQWEKVYVFISSTFNDMHAERDYLVKQVFPRLQEWCERRKLRLVDIDLRWGVTEADASENKRVVQVCLERIDACRPFFLCFLGQRRGWVPSRGDISTETYEAYPGLERVAGDASVTELEILHAFVNPLQGTDCARAEHSFFYLREPDCLDDLPGDVPGLREVYTNAGITDPAARRQADRQLARWREVEIPRTGRPMHAYTARWDAQSYTPEIRLPLECPSTAERGTTAWQSALARWTAQWAQAGVRADPSGDIADPREREKAEQYNARLAQGRLVQFTCDGRPLANAILADLQAAIAARYPEHVEEAVLTPLQRELDQQAQFLEMAGEGFIEREGDFSGLDDYVGDSSERAFFLTAPGGLGKTSLLARWIDRAQLDLRAGESLHYRFIGASDGSTTVDALLRSLLAEIKDVAGKLLEEEIPAEPDKLRAALPALLGAAGKRGKTVLVLDGLNQLESGMDDLAWLPLALPSGIRLVASFKRGDTQAEKYVEQLRAGGQAMLTEVKHFEGLVDRRKLVRAYLSQFLKELDVRHLEALIRSEGASNPLYLKVVLAELRVFGVFGDLGEKIRSDFGDTPVSAFAGLLRRLEGDPAYSPVQPERLVPRLFGWLAHARTGLTAEEMGALLVREGLLAGDEAGRERASEAVYGLLRQVRPYLSRREGRFDFFYESFELAVRERYATGEGQTAAHPEGRTAQEWHTSLAEYFDAQPLRLGTEQAPNRHKLAELAYQLAHAGMAKPLKRTLWDYCYQDARLEGSGIEPLIADYDLAGLPEAGLAAEARQSLALLQQALRLSAHVLGRDAHQLASQLTGRLLGFEAGEIGALLEAARRETHRPWLRPLTPSLERPGGALVRTLRARGGAGALALAADGRTAVSACYRDLTIWDLDAGSVLRTAQARDEVSAVVLAAGGQSVVAASRFMVWVLNMVSGSVQCSLDAGAEGRWDDMLSTDGRLAAMHTYGRGISIRDVSSGQVVQTLAGHPLGAERVAITPDGRRAISAASKGGDLKIWDVSTGAELYALAGHGEWHVNAVAITPDGRLAASGARDRVIKVWDVSSGRELRTLAGHSGPVNAVVLTPDGRLAVSGSDDKTIKVWDAAGGRELCSLTGHTAPVTAVALTPDGRFCLSGCRNRDNTLKLWDIPAAIRAGTARSAEARPRRGHASEVESVVVSADGRRAVSASGDGTLKVWDAATGAELRTLAGHAAAVRAVALTPDGHLAVSGSNDGALKVWDVETGAELGPLARPADQPKHDPVRAVLVTTDGKGVVAEVAGRLREWQLATGEELRVLDGYASDVGFLAQSVDGRLLTSQAMSDSPKVWDMARDRMMHRLDSPGEYRAIDALTPDLRLAITSASLGSLGRRERQRTVWDVAGGKEILTLRGQPRSRKASTADGRLTVQERADGTLKVLDTASGQEILTPAAYAFSPRAFTPDERFAVSVDGRTLKVFDISPPSGSGQPCWAELGTMSGHTSWINCLALTPDGRLAVSASEDMTVKVWDVASRAEVRTLTGHRENISSVALAPDGRRAVSASFDGVLKVWNTETGEALHTWVAHPGPVNSVAIALGTYAVSASVDRTLRVWLLRSGIALRTLAGHARSVNAVAVTPTGRPAVSASDDRTLKVWDIMSGKVLRTLSGHDDRVTDVALTKDGRLAVSASADRTLKVWDVAGGTEVRTLTGHSGPVTSVALAADGRLAVSAGMDMTLRLWDVAGGREVLVLSGLSDRATAVAINADGGAVLWAAMDGVIRVWGIQDGPDERQPPLLAGFTAEGDIGARIAVTPDGRRIVAGDKAGAVHFLQIEGVTPGPAVVTPWRGAAGSPAFGCPHCRVWSEVAESTLGTELPCPQCGTMIRLNSFAVEADWHPVEAAWKGER